MRVAPTEVPYVAAFTYDNLNRTKEISYPQNPRTNQGARACYTYNTFGYLQSVAVRANAASAGGCDESIINSTAYNEFGQITQVAYGNSVTANYQYDVKGRLEYIQTTAPNGATTKTIQNAQYTFDAQDRIKRVQNGADDFQTDYQYAYDGINRLITATGSYVETDDGTGTAQTTPLKYKHRYGYAENGNLTRRDYVDPDTDALNERWNYTYVNHQARTIDSTVDGARFQMSYDLTGNMTAQIDLKTNKEKQITLDSYDRIREVRDPTITEAIGQYWYDDRGFRIRKKAKHDKGGDFTDVETVYPSMYFGMELIGESGTLNSVSNIYHNGLRIAAVAQNGAKVWYIQDQADSVKLVMGSAGQVLSRAEYLPYGETFVQKGDADFAPKYNSQELDRETNYYFYNARYYDPQIARFTSADTIIDGEGSSQGWNRYMYVHGNPIGAKDPTGHGFMDVVSGVIDSASKALSEPSTASAAPGPATSVRSSGGGGPTASPAGGVASGRGAQMSAGKGIARGPVERLTRWAHENNQPSNHSWTGLVAAPLEMFIDAHEAAPGFLSGGRSLGQVFGLDTGRKFVNEGHRAHAEMGGAMIGTVAGILGSAPLQASKKFSDGQRALVEMAKRDKQTGGITKADMQAYKDLNKELGDHGFTKKNAVRGPEMHPNRPIGKKPHGHVGPVDHIPIKD